MKPIKRIIYTNNFNNEDYKEAKEWLEDQTEGNVDDNDIYNQLYFQDEINYEDFESDFADFIYNNRYILQGSVGTWLGKRDGGFIFDSFSELSNAWEGCDNLEVYDENGHLYISCSHHDGDNFYEIRMLNSKGDSYYANHYLDDPRELHSKLMKSPYSVLPNYAYKVFGCKKREYEAIS